MLPTEPGLHPGLSFAEYCSVEGINHSTLKPIARTPAHCEYERTHPSPETEPQKLGHAIHAAVLEPDVFGSLYARGPDGDGRTKKFKEAWAEIADEYPDANVLRGKHYDACLAVRDGAWSNATVRALLSAAEHKEVTAVWIDRKTGLKCKARIDAFTMFNGFGTVSDLKTTHDASERSFMRNMVRYGGHTQAASYLDGLDAIAPATRRHVWIAVESSPPHATAVYELDSSGLEQGRQTYRQWLDRFHECDQAGVWPAFEDGIHPVQLPEWAMRYDEWIAEDD